MPDPFNTDVLMKQMVASDTENVTAAILASVTELGTRFDWTCEEASEVSVAMLELVRNALAAASDSTFALVRQTFMDFNNKE